MQLMDAIYKRRAVRSFQSTPVSEELLQELLRAAVQAPSAVNRQPWAFAIIEGRELLRDYSDRAKKHLFGVLQPGTEVYELRDMIADPNFNIFYDAGTLVVICARNSDPGAAEDCCLAAENFMLAAVDFGLATCPIGFARPWLNTPEAKRDLNLPDQYTVVMPLIVGYPATVELPPVERKAPDIVARKRSELVELHQTL